MKQIQREHLLSEIEKMTTISIYMLMKEKGADMFGLWSAERSDILRAFKEQIGFKP